MRYQRNTAVRETEVEGDFFLVEPISGEIYYLDAITSGVWRLLDVPRDRSDILGVFKRAFPETPASRIVLDLDRALADLLKGNLIFSSK